MDLIVRILLLGLAVCLFVVKARTRHVFNAGSISTTVTASVGANVILHCDLDTDLVQNITWNYGELEKVNFSSNQEHRSQKLQLGSVLKIIDVRYEDAGKYECKDLNSGGSIKNILKVGRPPDRQENLSCVTHHSLKSMRCCWDVGRNTGITTDYSMKYFSRTRASFHYEDYYDGKNDESDIGICSSIDESNITFNGTLPRQCCDIQLEEALPETEIVIQLVSENVLGSSASPDIDERPLAWIKPNPPTELKLAVHEEVVGYTMIVTWKPPNTTIDQFEYRIRYRISDNGERPWDYYRQIMTNRYEFMIVRSHLLLEVQVAAWPIGLYSGYWSDWSKSALNSTGILSPSSPMRYETIVRDIFEDEMTITVEWIPYGRLDEPGIYNKFTYKTCEGELIESKNISALKSSDFTKMDITKCILIFGAYCNSVGCSKDDGKIIKYSQVKEKEYVESVHFNTSSSGYSVKWKLANQSSISRMCLIKIIGYQRLYGGEIDNESSGNTIVSETMPCNTTQYFLPEDPSICMTYISEVIIWDTEDDVTYNITFKSNTSFLPNPEIPAFGSFAVESTSRQTAMLHVSWAGDKNMTYPDLVPQILYTPIDGSECSNRNNALLCNSEFFSEAQNATHSFGKVTVPVYGDTNYEVRLGMCCHSKKSTCYFPNSNVTNTVKTEMTAPGKPFNFQWNQLRKDVLSWEAPIHTNGDLDGYLIDVRSDNDSYLNTNFTTSQPHVKLVDICVSYGEDKFVIVHVYAYNQNKNGEILLGDPVEIQSITCISRVFHHSSIAIIVIAVVSIILILSIAGFSYYHKQHIKDLLLRRLWPSVPRPNVIVAIQDHERDGAEYLEMGLLSDNTGSDEGESPNPLSSEEEHYDDIRLPLTNDIEDEPVIYRASGVNNNLTSTNNLSTSKDEEEHRSLLQNDAGTIFNDTESTTVGTSKEEAAFSPNGEIVARSIFHNMDDGNNCVMLQPRDSSRERDLPRLSQGDDSGHVSYSFVSSPNRDELNSKSIVTCDEVPNNKRRSSSVGCESDEIIYHMNYHDRHQNDVYRSEGKTRYGSTPSLPSYLSCSSFPFRDMPDNYSACRGSNFASISEEYQWSMPEYTVTFTPTHRNYQSSSGEFWPGLQSTPCEQMDNRRDLLGFNLDESIVKDSMTSIPFLKVAAFEEEKYAKIRSSVEDNLRLRE